MRRLFARSILWVGVLNIFMALGAWKLNIAPDVQSALIVSFLIGYSVLITTLLPICITTKDHPLFRAMATAIGLIVGLLMAGVVMTGDAWYFITEDNFTLYISSLIAFFCSSLAFFTIRLYATQKNLKNSELKILRQSKQLSEVKLRALQKQIEPHFLFNTLANVIGLIDTQPSSAKRVLESLSRLLRSSLSDIRDVSILLEEELELIQAYLNIQRIRMGTRLRFTLTNYCSAQSHKIPPLLLQPIVENAIVHGIDKQSGGGCIDIKMEVDQGYLCIQIRDDGKGVEIHAVTNKSIGLDNIRERLANLYNNQSTLTIEPVAPQGTIVTITIPVAMTQQ